MEEHEGNPQISALPEVSELHVERIVGAYSLIG
jgi:hypothetical protein